MMNHTLPGKEEILRRSSKSGLLAYLVEISKTRTFVYDTTFTETVADLINSHEAMLVAEEDWVRLERLGSSSRRFFDLQPFLCNLIPLVDMAVDEMMRLVAALVRLGGEDLAANRPNAAFREWCKGDLGRVRGVLDAARAGDPLAADHLCFALEAGNAYEDALCFLREGPDVKTRIAAAVALGRMALQVSDAEAAVNSLAEVSAQAGGDLLRYNALMSCYAVLSSHSTLPRDTARHVLNAVVAETSPEGLHALSGLLWRQGGNLTADEMRAVLTALRDTDPANGGTLRQIDDSTSDLTRAGHFDALADLVTELVGGSKGQLTLEYFPSFRRELLEGNPERLGRRVVSWLTDGNQYVCSALASELSSASGEARPLECGTASIPAEPVDQLLVCRRAVGFLFHAPVTAASVLLTVLHRGDSQIAADVSELLYDPLLLSYGGDLRKYLEAAASDASESVASSIACVLDRKLRVLGGFDGTADLVELHPSEAQRQTERVRWDRHMMETMKEAMNRSIFARFVTTQYLLYGRKSSVYVEVQTVLPDRSAWRWESIR